MGFKSENNYPLGRYIITLALAFVVMAPSCNLFAQEACPIRTAVEPKETEVTRAASDYAEVPFQFFSAWDSLTDLRASDDRYTTVTLPSYKRSTLLKANGLAFDIPANAHIHGLRLTVEGRTTGQGAIAETDVRLTMDDLPIGENKAGTAGLAAWTQSEEDITWSYGGERDTWGLPLTEDMLNSIDFGYQMQIRNRLSGEMQVNIDQITATVYYTPLYSICEHSCVTYYVDSLPSESITYNWLLPEGYKLLSYSEHAGIINVGVHDATFGTYEICVETLDNDIVTGLCCREFNYDNCNPAYIGDQVWQDQNGNAVFDNGDTPLANVLLSLYDGGDNLVSTTTTDGNGRYTFAEILAGDYYIEVESQQGLTPVVPNIGDQNQDSDITGANGPLTTDIIVVAAGDSLTNIDLGLSEHIFFGDLVWEDLNGDGQYQDTEPGIADATIAITNSLGPVTTASSEADGSYLAGPFPTGSYTLQFTTTEGLIPTILNAGPAGTDSDIDAAGSTAELTVLTGGFVDSLDAGYFREVTIGDFVWLDDNFDGLQDDTELGLAGIKIQLLADDGTVIDSITTDSTGFYQFVTAPGTYRLKATDTRQFIPTLTATSDSLLNSDLIIEDGMFVTNAITLTSGEQRDDLDLGFVDQPTDIGGLVWDDLLADGQRTDDEPGKSGVSVELYTAAGELVATTTTDSLGEYQFLEIYAGDYYVTFAVDDTELPTLANQGSDDTDSDLSSSVVENSTDIIAVLPGVNDFTIWVGLTQRPSIGDQVWVDINRNGLQDDGEIGVNGVLVRLLSTAGDTLATTLTATNTTDGQDGYYLFDNLDVSSYQVQFEVDTFFLFTTANVAPDSLNSDAVDIAAAGSIRTGTTAVFAVERNENNNDIDAGIVLPLGGIAGQTFVDVTADGLNNLARPLPNVLVSVFDETDAFIDSTRTDAAGVYIFPQLPDGNYYVVFDQSARFRFTDQNVGSDDSIDSDVDPDTGRSALSTVSATSTPIIDAGYLDGRQTVSGFTWIDDNGDGVRQSDELPLAGVQVQLYTIDGTAQDTTLTDNDGGYEFGELDAGQFYLVFDAPDATFINTTADQGGDDTVDDDVTSSIATNSTDTLTIQYFENTNSAVDAGYYQFASVGDQAWIDLNDNSIRDEDEVGIDGIGVELLDINDNIVASTITSAGGGLDSGYYQLDMIPPGEYRLRFTRVLFYAFVDGDQGTDDTDSDVTTVDDLTGTTELFTLTSGQQDVTRDVGLEFSSPMESSISGTLWDDLNANGIRDMDEPPLTAALVFLRDLDQGVSIGSMVPDENGFYIFDNLGEGTYLVEMEIPKAYTVLNAGTDDTIDSDIASEIGSGPIFLGVFEDIVVDCGQAEPLFLRQEAWEDLNANGIRDVDEPPVEGIEVSATSIIGTASAERTSNENGRWQFDLPASIYDIRATAPEGYTFTLPNVGDDDFDSDVEGDGTLLAADFTSGGTIENFDIGVIRNGSITGETWIDFNANGRQGNGEPGLDSVIVNLYRADGTLVRDTVTNLDADGVATYTFDDVRAGEYYVEFIAPVEFLLTDADQGTDTEDSDITNSNGPGTTDVFLVGSGADVQAIDGGFYLPASLGDRVWFDTNMDGLQDADEPGIAGLQVILYRSFGLPIDTVITDGNGFYQFESLRQGLYFIGFEVPEMFAVSPMDVGNDESVDSDCDESGTTPLISLAHGTELLDVDCGLFESISSLRSTAWEDRNGDGLRQMDEPRVANVRVELMDESGTVIDSTYTNSLGKYAFESMALGNYYIHVDLQDFDFEFTTANMGDDYIDSDIMPSGDSEMFSVADSLSTPNVDIGLYHMGQLVMNVWNDSNANRNQEANEDGIENVMAEIYKEDGTLAYEVMSATGRNNVIVEDMLPGTYFVALTPPEEYAIGSEMEPGDDMYHQTNSDLILTDLGYETPLFLVSSGSEVRYIDAGFRAEPISIIGDTNSTIDVSVGPNPSLYFVQLEDISDVPLQGECVITLTDREGALISQQTTDDINAHVVSLTDVKSGVYYLTVQNGTRTVTKKLLKITP